MDLTNVIIKEYDKHTAIEYPKAETKGSITRSPSEMFPRDYDFNHGLKKHMNFRIHHVETLQPPVYFLRCLIDHETNKGTLLKRYVVVVRVNLSDFGHDDFLELIEKAIDKINQM